MLVLTPIWIGEKLLNFSLASVGEEGKNVALGTK